MSTKKFKTSAPFGIATKRFAKIGFHPQLDVTGAMKKQITKVGPGSYYTKYPACKSKRGMNWKLKLETEAFSKFLNYKNVEILQQREFHKTLGGPGHIDRNEEYYKKQKCSALENVGFGTVERFKYQEKKDMVPPPDTYFRNISKLSTIRKQLTNVPTFEWDGFVDRFKSTAPRYTLAPNRYLIEDDKGIDAKTKRIVSLRGPYDLFTGPRDNTTIKNHFSPPSGKVPDYFYVKPSDSDALLHDPSQSRKGKFLKAKRFAKKPTCRNMLLDPSLCYRDPNYPGPAHYDFSNITSIKTVSASLYPFDTSKENARPPPNWTIFPGPGRYNPKLPKCQKLKRPSWVFLSKLSRDIFTHTDYKAF